MKIVHVPGGEYQDVLGSYDEYSRFDDGSEEEVFFYGYNSTKRNDLKDKYAGYKRKVYLTLEAPCSFLNTSDAITSQSYFDQVYTICPYTARWLTDITSTEYIAIPQPYREEYFEKYNEMPEKTKDVIYHGGVHSPLLSEAINVMMDYDYVFVNLFKDPRTTHRKVRSERKWDLIASSKCSITANLLFPNKKHIANLKTYDGWWDNEAFNNLGSGLIPQAKARVIEAAACQTLNLVKRDEWNLIEFWFSKDEFVYWDSFDELRHLIDDVSKNFDRYIPIIERAHKRVKNYTTTEFIRKVNENETRDFGLR